MTANKIILIGGSGFLGRTLAKWWGVAGKQVVVISRSKVSDLPARHVSWDGENLGPWAKELEGADVVVNLAGRSVDCRYHQANRKQMMDSRLLSTRVLGKAIKGCAKPPKLWMNSSTATIYKHTYGAAHQEDTGIIGAHADAKDEFSVQIAKAWEEEFAAAVVPGTRKVVLRTAMVFGNEPGGVYQVMRKMVRLGLGGTMGDGRQFMSWIHTEDFAVPWIG